MVDVVGTPQAVRGTVIKWKVNSGGTYGVVNKCTTRKLPSPVAVTEEVTAIDSACVKETNQVVDYGDLELEIIYDRTDTVHAAMLASVGSRVDGYYEITGADGFKMEFQANAKQFGDKNTGPKNNQRADFKAHCNTVPVITDPT